MKNLLEHLSIFGVGLIVMGIVLLLALIPKMLFGIIMFILITYVAGLLVVTIFGK